MDLTQIVKGVTLTKVCNIKAHKDSTNVKQISCEILFDGVSLQGVFDKAVSSTVIQWQNGPGRDKIDTWIDKQVVKINFKAPGVTTIDPEVAMKAKLASMTVEERQAKVMELLGDLEA